jgi:hypothetical protein
LQPSRWWLLRLPFVSNLAPHTHENVFFFFLHLWPLLDLLIGRRLAVLQRGIAFFPGQFGYSLMREVGPTAWSDSLGLIASR